MVSYEVSIGIIIIVTVSAYVLVHLNLNDIVVIAQKKSLVCQSHFFLCLLFFFISALAETNRPPFDLPEAEAELVAGYQTEYSGMMYATVLVGRIRKYTFNVCDGI